MIDQTPPHSVEAERAIIGCSLVSHAEIYSDVADIRPNDFFIPHHRCAWEAIKSLEKRGSEINIATFLDEVKTLGHLSAFPDSSMWPVQCASESPIPQLIQSYVGILKKHATLRRVIALCTESLARAYSNAELDQIVESMRTEIASIEVDADSAGPIRIVDLVDSSLVAIKERTVTEKSKITIGIEQIDKLTGGLRVRQMSVWAGLPGMGKTAAALSVIARNVERKIPCIVFSLEMDRQDIIERILSMRSRVSCQSLITGSAASDLGKWNRVEKAAKDITFLPMWVDDRNLTCNQICGEAHRWYAKHVRKNLTADNLPPALIVVDYLGQIPSEERAENRNREVARMVHRLKAMAKSRTMNVHVMVLSQLNNEAAKRGGYPMAADMRDSGEIWAAADLVVFPWRDKEKEFMHDWKDPVSALHIIDKNKSGPAIMVEVYWHGPSMEYVGIDEWKERNR